MRQHLQALSTFLLVEDTTELSWPEAAERRAGLGPVGPDQARSQGVLLHLLVQRYGPELGAKLGQHEAAVGMRWEHVVVCYGQPPAGAVQQLAGHPNHWHVQYGSPATGSYFELLDEVVTVARLGVPPLLTHKLELLNL